MSTRSHLPKKKEASMPNRHPFNLNRSGVLLALISAAFAGQAGAAAGRVDFTVGGATVSGPDGQQRPLAKGAELDSGDTVRTNNGRAQIRFTDGAYVSLQPNTDFSIKEYNFDGKTDGSERGFFGLAKGAMRAVTGLIGRVNRSRYAITTPTATVGIRGTGGLIAINNDGSTTITGTSGIWTLTNPSGTLDIPAGTVGTAPASPNQPPKQTDQPPSVGPTPPSPPPTFTQGDQRNPDGSSPFLPPLTSGSGYASAVAFGWFGSPELQASNSATAVFNSSGQLTSVAYSDGQIFKLDPSGVVVESGNDGIVAWGRWTGTVTGLANIDGLLSVNETYDANQGLHYVIGMPTPVMPVSGTASYALLGATSPTFTNMSAAPGTFSGGLTVDFGQQTVTLGMIVSMPSAGTGYAIAGTTNYANSSFSSSASFSGGSQFGQLSIAGTTGASCTCFCSASVQGFFAGASAERAGLGYRISDAGSGIVGAAAFKKTGP
jgi:hypothetical protein